MVEKTPQPMVGEAYTARPGHHKRRKALPDKDICEAYTEDNGYCAKEATTDAPWPHWGPRLDPTPENRPRAEPSRIGTHTNHTIQYSRDLPPTTARPGLASFTPATTMGLNPRRNSCHDSPNPRKETPTRAPPWRLGSARGRFDGVGSSRGQQKARARRWWTLTLTRPG